MFDQIVDGEHLRGDVNSEDHPSDRNEQQNPASRRNAGVVVGRYRPLRAGLVAHSPNHSRVVLLLACARRPSGMIRPMSHVVVLTTGGTIASVRDKAGVLRPARTGAELLGDTPGDVVDLMAKDSSELTLGDWDLISAHIDDAVTSGATGVVATHGTATLEETARG